MQGENQLSESSVPQKNIALGYSLFVVLIAFLAYAVSAMDAGMFGIALPSVARAIHITGSQGEYIISIGMVLSVIAGLFIGPLTDRFGRVKMLQIVLLFTGVFSALTALVANFIQIMIVRVLCTIGLDNVGPSNTLVSEETIPSHRGLFMGVMQAGYPVGMALAGTIAAFYLPTHWRVLFVIAFIPALVIVIAAFGLRESKDYVQARAVNLDVHKKLEWSQLFESQLRKQTWVLLVYTFLINGGIGAQCQWTGKMSP